MDTAFERAVEQIEREYRLLEHRLGWRFLCTPRKTLHPSTPIVLITSNPGGNSIPPEHAMESCENGSAYLNEEWGESAPGEHPLQRQIQHLFEEISDACGRGVYGGPALMKSSLCAYFIPFRSPRLSALDRYGQSLAFGRRMWAELFQSLAPRLVVTIDRRTHAEIRAILQRRVGRVLLSSEELPTGWGAYTATLDSFEVAGTALTLLRLPHLSTFRLFTSSKSRDKTAVIVRRAAKSLAVSEHTAAD